METVTWILQIAVCFNYILKQTYRKKASILFSALICSLFIGFTWPYAIEQSKSQISDWLANRSLMLDMAVILTWEVCIQIAFCMLSVHIETTGQVEKRTIWIYRFLRWFPDILIFPVLFSLLVSTIFSFPGITFSHISWSLAGITFVLIPLGSWIIRYLLPEKEIRLELFFLSNVFIALLGIITTVNGDTAVSGISEINWPAFGCVVLLIGVGILTGLVIYQIRLNKTYKQKQNVL